MNRALKVKRNRIKTKNMMLKGNGGNGKQDRGAMQTADSFSSNPYFNNSVFSRWQEYTRWYMTSWEARKIIDIPVFDALRIPVEVHGLEDEYKDQLLDAYNKFGAEKQIRKALIQERLLGGSCIFGVFLRPENEDLNTKMDYSSINKGDLKALNVIDISKITRSTFDNDPFSEDYDRIDSITVQGHEIDCSRICLFDGDAIFNRTTQQIFQGMRVNYTGFGESKLAPLYDTLVRVSGTQQGAYHLVNLASCLLVTAKRLRSLKATDNPALEKLEDIVENLNLYRGAVIDGEDIDIREHSSSFGSVPELVMSFLQILSAGSDIPATRFLGQAPGGLNASGDGDLENYYNSIASFQQSKLLPIQTKIFTWIGCSLWGYELWEQISQKFKLEYTPLWNLSEVEQSQVDQTYANIVHLLSEAGIIDVDGALEELKQRKIFLNEDISTGTPIYDPLGDSDDAFNPGTEHQEEEGQAPVGSESTEENRSID